MSFLGTCIIRCVVISTSINVENGANVDHVNVVSDVDLVVPIDVEGCTDDCYDFAIKAEEVASNVC